MTLITGLCISSPFNQICIFVGQELVKKILKDFSHWNKCEYVLPYCGPSRPPGTIIWTKLNLNYIRKLSCKYELFWLWGSWEDFKMIPPYFCKSMIISPWERTWPLFWIIFHSFHPRMICTKFDWNWPAGSGEDDCFRCKHVNMVFLIVAPPDPWGPWFEETWNYIISESFHVNMSSSGSVVLEKKIFIWPLPIFAFL
jgi:hypothetical protein